MFVDRMYYVLWLANCGAVWWPSVFYICLVFWATPRTSSMLLTLLPHITIYAEVTTIFTHARIQNFVSIHNFSLQYIRVYTQIYKALRKVNQKELWFVVLFTIRAVSGEIIVRLTVLRCGGGKAVHHILNMENLLKPISGLITQMRVLIYKSFCVQCK